MKCNNKTKVEVCRACSFFFINLDLFCIDNVHIIYKKYSNCPKQVLCIVVFWVITPCSLVGRYQCSKRASAKKMEAGCVLYTTNRCLKFATFQT
jgi:hypothetical protein